MATATMVERRNVVKVLSVSRRYTGDPDSAPNPSVNQNLAIMFRKAADELESINGSIFEAQDVTFRCNPESDPEMHLEIDLYHSEQ